MIKTKTTHNHTFQKKQIFAVFSKHSLFAIFVFTLCLGACRQKKYEAHGTVKSAEKVNSGFVKTEIKHAKGFSIEYFEHHKVVSIISPFENAADTTRYILVQRGHASPEILGKSVVIEIPLRSLATTSSMHVGLLTFLNAEHILTGLSSLQYVYSPEVVKMIAAGKVAEIGKDQGINEEKLVNIRPDLIMTTGSPASKMEHYRTLSDAGIPVISNSEWIESTPLGRAEWVKIMAALLNKEELANEKFAKIETEYQMLTDLAAKAGTKPLILSGLNTKDVWFMPNGNSYMARFFKDAGGNFPWPASEKTGSLPLSFESVYSTALKADYWLNVGFNPKDTRKSIRAQDSRYKDFNAYKSGKLFSYNKRVNERGSNDFFESGNVNPQIVLSDLIKILHPELLPDHQLVYYKQLE